MNKKTIAGLVFGSLVSMGLMSNSMAKDTANESKVDDPYLWLEDVGGEKALEWVEQNNEKSLGYLQSKPLYKELYEKKRLRYDDCIQKLMTEFFIEHELTIQRILRTEVSLKEVKDPRQLEMFAAE